MEETKIQNTDEATKEEQGKVETTSEEKQPKTYSEEEVAEIKKNAIAEGMRKASKTQSEEYQTKFQEQETKLNEMQEQLKAFKNVEKMNELGIDNSHHKDLIAIIKGNGEEITDETIQKYSEQHPEWKKEEQKKGVEQLGKSYQPNQNDEEEKARQDKIKKMFRL